MSMRPLFWVLPLALVWSFYFRAQPSEIYTNSQAEYQKALELYQAKQYQAAQSIFRKVEDQSSEGEIKANCKYYIASTAIRLNQLYADRLMEDFVRDYPHSTKQNSAFIDVADYYFDQGNYVYATKWYSKARQASDRSMDERHTFQLGYSYFSTNNLGAAETQFNRIANSKTYGYQARYYLGYIAYQTDNYAKAEEYFGKLDPENQGQEKIGYFRADMNFKTGDFQKAIDNGLSYLPNADRREESQLNKIIGESYFNLENYEEAIPYLEAYKGKGGRWSNTDLYLLGYAHYKMNDYEAAAEQFNKIVDGKDAVAQNAYYHLADCYLHTDRKSEALNAFRLAASMPFDPIIKEDAAYNYGKLSYDIGSPYESTPKILTSFLESYPSSPVKSEIESLLVNAYVSSKNYKDALDLMSRSPRSKDQKIYQQVSLLYGLELYDEGNYLESIKWLDKSIEQAKVPRLTANALYWKASALYALDQFDEALVTYKELLLEPASAEMEKSGLLQYHLGYTYFKLKNYEQALASFERFLNKYSNQNDIYTNDAWLRLGDTQFALGKYWPAIESYDKVITSAVPGADYALYQKSICYGFVNRVEHKIDGLVSMKSQFPDSNYMDDALYELGNTWVSTDEIDRGIGAYDEIIINMPKSSYVPKAMQKKGLVLYNSGKNEEALKVYRSLVSRFPATPEAKQAVATSKLIYIDLGRINEYTEWVKDLDFVEVSDQDLDQATYTSAEKQYAQQNNKQAIKAFQDYLNNFPKGLHILEAHFYLAELLFAEQNMEGALPHYLWVASQGQSEYSEPVLVRLAQYYLDLRDETNAMIYLNRLENEADYPQNQLYAQSNLMKIYYRQSQYKEAVNYALTVLEKEQADKHIISDARLILARSAFEVGDLENAKSYYEQLKEESSGVIAAEALYYEAFFQNQEEDYEKSNETIQRLAKEYSTHREFGAKGLVLMAKNFYALQDAFQATYILESVIANFKEYPKTVEEAKNLLELIKIEEAKRNTSVQTPDKN